MSYTAKQRRHARRTKVRAITFRRQERRMWAAERGAAAILRTFA